MIKRSELFKRMEDEVKEGQSKLGQARELMSAYCEKWDSELQSAYQVLVSEAEKCVTRAQILSEVLGI